MDAIIYIIILYIIGMYRKGSTMAVSETEGIVSTGGTTTVNCELPYGQNLALYKEQGAYTLILQELGLIKC